MIKKLIQKILGQPKAARGPVDFGKRVEIPASVHGINPALVDELSLIHI
jgi:poly(A) polymerase